MNKENLVIFGEHEPDTITQMHNIIDHKESPKFAVLCADGHLGYSVPIGGVLAYENRICVNGVGYDIACGNKAVLLDADSNNIKRNIYREMNEIQKNISFGIGRKNNEKVDNAIFDSKLWTEVELLRDLKDKASEQLGTVGSGNHYVDIFTDELNRIWIGVHFGSRGLGHNIASYFIKKAGGKDGINAEPVVLDENSDLGCQYLKCMEIAGRYAYAGRDWVCNKVASLLRANVIEEVHNHHNYAWKESHFGKELWVIRKGATPAFPGQKGFVGGSMGDLSFILEGVESKESQTALYSTVHGAGRRMGRMEAKGKYDKKGNCIRQGIVKKEEHEIRMQGIELRGGGLDESPYAYKNIEEVIYSHKNTINILHSLKPIGVCMADDRTKDPYKD